MHYWAVVALLAGALSAAASITNKYIFVRLSKSPVVQIVSAGIVGMILATIVSAFHGYHTLVPSKAILGVISGVAFGLSLTMTLTAIQKGHVSQVTPLRFLSTVFVVLIAIIFLHEVLPLKSYIGIALIVFGAAMLDEGKLKNIFRANSVLGYMALSGFAYAVMITIIKYLDRFGDIYSVLFYTRLGLLLYTLPFLLKNLKLMKSVITPRPLRNLSLLTIAGTFGTSSLLLVVFASAHGPVTIVSALAATSPFFALLYISSLHRIMPDVYQDKSGSGPVLLKRLAISALMFVGVLLTL